MGAVMNRYAIIDATSTVINVVIWDGKAKWSPPLNTRAIQCIDAVSIGWTYAEGIFYPPQVTG